MLKYHMKHTFEAKYLSDYSVLSQLNKCTLLLQTPDGKEQKLTLVM